MIRQWHSVKRPRPPAEISQDNLMKINCGSLVKFQSIRPWMWVTSLTILGAVLRTIGLNSGLWLDEIMFLVNTVLRLRRQLSQ
jgi:hypothetical protein